MDIRYQPGQPLQVNLLTSRELLDGHIVNLAGRVATIAVRRPVAFGSPLRIDFDDCMILGEASACESGPESYLVKVDVRDAIPVMSDLARLVSAVMMTGRRETESAAGEALAAKRKR